MKTFYVLSFTLLLSINLYSQDEFAKGQKDKNSISLNIDTYFGYFKEGSSFYFSTFALAANYQRTILKSGNYGMSGEFGLGLKYPQGSTEFMRIDKTANLFLNGNYINNHHKIDIGIGGIGSFQDGLRGAVKLRYTNFVEENKFVFVAFNQVVWYSAGQSNKDETDKFQRIWFWDSKTNDFIVNIGMGLTF